MIAEHLLAAVQTGILLLALLRYEAGVNYQLMLYIVIYLVLWGQRDSALGGADHFQ